MEKRNEEPQKTEQELLKEADELSRMINFENRQSLTAPELWKLTNEYLKAVKRAIKLGNSIDSRITL